MATDTQKRIDQINESLAWIYKYRPDHFDQRFLQLVECRKVLKKIAAAEVNNPGIAAFGKSQVGKSYLISCLLQDNGKPFLVRAGDKVYNFVFNINPPSEEGGGRESTGVVSRFSSFKRNPDAYHPDFPVLVKTFTIVDIVIILADSYFNDFANYTSLSESEINALSDKLAAEYSSKKPLPHPIVSADEILYMKDYFSRHINNAQAFNNSSFFNQLALLIERIPPAEYVDIFSNLWNRDSNLTRLYGVLYDTLNLFGFAPYIYLPIEAVLHNGVRENTIMSVQCLKKLFDNSTDCTSDVYTMEGGGLVKRASNLPKSVICAICSEVVFKVEDSFFRSTGHYDMTGIGDDVRSRINHEQVQMTMLRDNDLLDFPGARSREQEDVGKLSENSVLLNCFLRGKVAYLFNKYNEEMGINILLYCHHNKDNDVTGLYKLLEEWVNIYVGRTPEERLKKLEMTKVSPLFYIGTMFNLDMSLGVGSEKTEQAIDQRWVGRFDTVMNKQCFHRDTVSWMRNWTHPGEDFKNSYMLRDFKFSGPKSGLYEGFEETNRETGMLMDDQYYQMMRQTFIHSPFVKQFFSDPPLSWDVAATMNNDGSLYIIEQLGQVASRMESAREAQFKEMTQQMLQRVRLIMKEYYTPDDTAELLAENIRKANGVFREMEFSCQNRPDYFGHLLQALQLTESTCFKAVHQLIPRLSATVNDTDSIQDYELIRRRCDGFKGCDSTQEKWQRLISAYHFIDQNDASEYLKSRKIDIQRLFQGSPVRRKNSAVIAHEILQLWEEKITGVQFMNQFSGPGQMDGIALTNLVNCLVQTADTLHLSDRVEKEIADYADVMNTSSINQELISDMIATAISDFVINFGYGYLTPDQVQTSMRVSREEHLPCFDWTQRERKETYDEEEITSLFNDILTSEGHFTPAYMANLYNWLEYMYVAFVANLDVPKKDDREANEQLKVMLEKLN